MVLFVFSALSHVCFIGDFRKCRIGLRFCHGKMRQRKDSVLSQALYRFVLLGDDVERREKIK